MVCSAAVSHPGSPVVEQLKGALSGEARGVSLGRLEYGELPLKCDFFPPKGVGSIHIERLSQGTYY